MNKSYFKHKILCVLISLIGSSASAPVDTYKIQCLYIYKFSQLIQWPGSKPNIGFTIGVIGVSPVIPVLQQYFDAKNKSSEVNYKIIKFTATQAIPPCSVLYITKEAAGNFDRIAKEVSGKPILLISETPGLAKRGSCINFIAEEGAGIKIEINKTAIESHGLRFSAELLKLGNEISGLSR